MDEFDRAMTMLVRVTGLFGDRGWPFIKVVLDDDEVRSYPIPDEEEKVLRSARKYLAQNGRKPIRPD
mgnify:CR=1 FL=1